MIGTKANKKGFIKNLFFSATSITLSVGFMQFVLLPIVSRIMDTEEYGFMLTLIAVVDIFSVTFGGTLCNVRLIKKEKYENVSGDFNLLGIVYSTLGCVLSIIICYIYGERSFVGLALLGLYSVVLFYHSYGSVFFRLKRMFNLELLSSLLMVAGYLTGYLILRLTGVWEPIYILGHFFAFVFSGIIYGKIKKEPLSRTSFFRETCKDSIQLNLSTFLVVLVTYTDKLILFKLMGGATVAIYHAAAIVGKCVALITNPLNGLFLTYISNNRGATKNYLRLSWFLAIGVVFFFYFILLFVSRPLLNVLYPQYSEAAMKIIPLTLLAAMVNVIYAMINPFILKAMNSKIQFYMNLTSLVVYLFSGFAFFKLWGLAGFCFALILAGIVKLFFLLFCTHIINKSVEDKEHDYC